MTKEQLDMVLEQAKTDGVSKNISTSNYQAYMYKGIKIINDNYSTRIETSGINYYREISDEQYKEFEKGWLSGVYRLSLKKYQAQLENLEIRVRDEMNGSKSMKVLEGHKAHRIMLNKKHEEVSKKLNNLTNKK